MNTNDVISDERAFESVGLELAHERLDVFLLL